MDAFFIFLGKIVFYLCGISLSLYLIIYLFVLIIQRIGWLGHFANFVSDKAIQKRHERKKKRLDRRIDPIFKGIYSVVYMTEMLSSMKQTILFDKKQKILKN